QVQALRRRSLGRRGDRRAAPIRERLDRRDGQYPSQPPGNGPVRSARSGRSLARPRRSLRRENPLGLAAVDLRFRTVTSSFRNHRKKSLAPRLWSDTPRSPAVSHTVLGGDMYRRAATISVAVAIATLPMAHAQETGDRDRPALAQASGQQRTFNIPAQALAS